MSILNVNKINPVGGGSTITIAGIASVTSSISIASSCTATTFYGSGSNLTGIDATKIITGNTQVQTIDTGSDGHVKISTEGGERLRIGPAGQIGIAGANYGTSGQVLTSQGSGSVVQWASPAVTGGNMFIAKMNSGYNTSNNTDGEIVFQNEVFDSDGTYNNSNGRFTPNVAGYYFIDASLQFSTNSANNNFESTIWKNGTEQFVNRMRNPAANTELHCKVSGIVSVNGSSDYISIAAWQNSGGNLTVNPGNGSYFMGFFLRSL